MRLSLVRNKVTFIWCAQQISEWKERDEMVFNVVALFGILPLYHLSSHVINVIEGMNQLLLGGKMAMHSSFIKELKLPSFYSNNELCRNDKFSRRKISYI